MATQSAAGNSSAEERPKRDPLGAALTILRQPSFPAPHLRTNAFVLERELMLRIQPGSLADKAGAYLLESGRRSFARQIERMGLQVLVAGRDGGAYAASEWPRSHTFWQGAQENLIVADNQTRSYESADFEVRSLLAAHAWGELAEPAMPDPGSETRGLAE